MLRHLFIAFLSFWNIQFLPFNELAAAKEGIMGKSFWIILSNTLDSKLKISKSLRTT